MRSGKPLLVVAFGILAAWLLEPLWQWYLDRILDDAAKTGGVTSMITAMIPHDPFLLGVSLGMLLTLGVGYRHVIAAKGKELALKVPEAVTSVRELVFRGHVIHRGVVAFEEGEMEKIVYTHPDTLKGAFDINFPPYSNVYGDLLGAAEGKIRFRRTDTSPRLVNFEVLGR